MRYGRTILVLAAIGTAVVLGTSHAQEASGAAAGSALLPSLALIAAAAALIVAAIALRKARQAQGELTRFTRSIEMALRELSTRSERDAATVGDLNRRIEEELRALAEAETAPDTAPQTPQPAVAAVPRAEAPQAARPPVERAAEPEPHEAAQAALARAVASGEAEISLQPIISVSQSTATAFEVHLHVEAGEGGRAVDIRRLAGPAAGVDAAAFETLLVRSAIAAGRRQLGTAAERMPFHVAISEAFLGRAQDVESIAELARVHKALPASLVFSVPAALLSAGGEAREGLDRLTASGFRLAAENWDGADAEAAARRGVAWVKIAANRLLDRERSRRRLTPGAELAAAAQSAGLAVVATGVARDEDAVGLIDLGVDLMVGERFSGPRRMRSAAARQAAMTGT